MESPVPEGDLGSHLKGDIIIPDLSPNDNESSNADYNTLDEPIMNTIVSGFLEFLGILIQVPWDLDGRTRDLRAVGKKIYSALAPSSSNLIVKEWDLWGPLIMCTYIGLMLQTIDGDSSGSQFTQLFVLFWLGVAVITYNFVFITASKISIFQCICVLGYCLGPLGIAVTIFESINLFRVGSGTLFLRFIIAVCGATWSAIAATRILKDVTTTEKRYMTLGPVVIFYALISLLILYHSAGTAGAH